MSFHVLYLYLVSLQDRLSLSIHSAAAPKKTKQERINERKAKRREGEVKKQPQDAAALTAEEKLEEERKHEEAQRASDLESAMELFGGTGMYSLCLCLLSVSVCMYVLSVSGSSGQLERMNPQTPEEFEEFRQALTKKITQFEVSLCAFSSCSML